ncbi:probable LRR receptor-like serine/threonine-protein kinase At4g29180 [Tripterygium wilfordii]|uniref:probable LRR receptor-like serine/threonine-protein kinase At4g29180 n=1 Tax=Tripterygium wilfordii TaxID=458696 RepID=UPI0018F83397|nr:probable LRR receptor-like serine/threonine-protein kinase At4g29180 [Tripterygium wilfordii]
MYTNFLLLLMLCIFYAIWVNGQQQTGYISIDCGATENFNYVDTDTGISYTSDGFYVDSGMNKNISSEYAYPNNPNLPLPLSDLRSFPSGNKNCYTLTTSAGIGSLNLIRASFLYGNYDGENKLPDFDLYVDVNLWTSVKFNNASHVVTTEIISTASSNATHVCLLNKGLGTPFISALELRPLNSSIYGTEYSDSASLVLFKRWDIGSTNGTGRYSDDPYDRIWSSYSSPSWNQISTSLAINGNDNGYKAPFEVIRTAARPLNDSNPMELSWDAGDQDSQFYIYMYFAEVEQLQRNQTRKFSISWNGSPVIANFTPRYLYAATTSNSRSMDGKEHTILIQKTEDSTLPPILNAVEIFMVKLHTELPTYSIDVDAIMNVKATYQVNKTWAGDPCTPMNYSWDGLRCYYNDSLPPRIIAMNLSSSHLSGTITASLARLSLLESLDLSNNNLTGQVPEFLKELKSLNFLNLKGNRLSGFVPKELLERSETGQLKLSVDEQNICGSSSCKKKNKIVVPIAVSVSVAAVLLIAFLALWYMRRKRREEVSKQEGQSIASKNQRFTYPEILSMTNNFQTVLGKGGFGTVYLGYLKDGAQVAVKMLSPSSSQGPAEFRNEAELLMRVHHRNLASFVGYCNDNNNLALLYEYMANGNLKDYLSATNLSWEMRLRAAIDAAQGLEYLHHGCKPPIVHRDVKTANILLSENLDAKLADFGLSKAFPTDDQSHVTTGVIGTTGYLDPEYYNTHKLTEKSDVYSFGIVLLELITGQPAVIKGDDYIHITLWVEPMLESGNIERLIDQRLRGDFDVNSVWKALEVAVSCIKRHPFYRAAMSSVLAELKQCLTMELQRVRERSSSTQESREEIYINRSENPPELYSMDDDLMTGPLAR